MVGRIGWIREREWTVRERMEVMTRGRRGDGAECIAWRYVAVEGLI